MIFCSSWYRLCRPSSPSSLTKNFSLFGLVDEIAVSKKKDAARCTEVAPVSSEIQKVRYGMSQLHGKKDKMIRLFRMSRLFL